MKKNIVSLILAAATVFTAAACNSGGASIGEKSVKENKIVSVAENSTEKVNFLTDGRTDYKVVYSKDISSTEIVAVSEMQTLFYEGTGKSIQTVYAEGLVYDENAKYVCIGENDYSRVAGVTADFKTLGSNGYRVKTVGNSVFIVGGGEWGTIWGVYDFLSMQMGYEFIYTDEILFDGEKCKNSTLISVDKTDKPDWEWRAVGDGENSNNKDLRTRLRMQSNDDAWTTNGTISMFHTFFSLSSGTYGFVPTASCLADHRNWYNLDYDGAESYPTSLCFSRDPQGLCGQIMSKIAELIEVGGSGNSIIINFSQLDGSYWCYCPDCQRTINKYGGALSSTQVLFMKNFLSPALDAYVKENCPEKDVVVYMYAYWNTKQPPSFSNEAQIEELKLPSNCGVEYCTGFPEKNPITQLGERAQFEAWAKITENFAIMDYAENFGSYMRHFDDYNKLQTNMEYFLNYGGKFHYTMMAYNNLANSDWSRLHAYLEAALSWDCTVDVNKLADNFFDKYYKDAAPYMKEWFYGYRAWSEVFDKNSVHGGSSLSLTMVKTFEKYAEKAFAAILKYKFSDPELYEKLYDRILLETLCYRYNYLDSYRSSVNDLKSYAESFKKDCAHFGIQKITEGQSFDAWYNANFAGL